MIDAELVKLLHGPYEPPRLHVGDRTYCRLRGRVVITSISAGRIPWPRCRGIASHGGSGLLLGGSLLRAVMTESAAAVAYWWGATHSVVIRWRKVLDVNRRNNEGTRRFLNKSAQAAAKAMQAREWTEAERKARRRQAKRQHLIQHARNGFQQTHGWTPAELELLGTAPDEDVATLIGRPVNAVRIKRTQLGIPTTNDRRRRDG